MPQSPVKLRYLWYIVSYSSGIDQSQIEIYPIRRGFIRFVWNFWQLEENLHEIFSGWCKNPPGDASGRAQSGSTIYLPDSYSKRIQSPVIGRTVTKIPGNTEEIGKFLIYNDFPKSVTGVTTKTVLCRIFSKYQSTIAKHRLQKTKSLHTQFESKIAYEYHPDL